MFQLTNNDQQRVHWLQEALACNNKEGCNQFRLAQSACILASHWCQTFSMLQDERVFHAKLACKKRATCRQAILVYCGVLYKPCQLQTAFTMLCQDHMDCNDVQSQQIHNTKKQADELSAPYKKLIYDNCSYLLSHTKLSSQFFHFNNDANPQGQESYQNANYEIVKIPWLYCQ